jgi:hypothetical protein
MIEMWQLWVGGVCRYGQNVFNASTDGVCQETCRDFGHMQMGMASAHYTAETAFIQGVDLWKEEQVRKRYFWATFDLKMIILPRQARDKHREKTKKSPVVLQTRLTAAMEFHSRWLLQGKEAAVPHCELLIAPDRRQISVL